ncbi:MAG: T9SS type A sorting domain-containing protein [Bacteroidetes bacterium]|nr:T9SS type A sorting domain-containing protein [Bacteroidota bacterium]
MKTFFTLLSFLFFSVIYAQTQNKAGTLDSSFGTVGKVLTSSPTGYLVCEAAASQSDGSIITAGGVSFVNSNSDDFFAIKYSSNGVLDSSFGKKGLAVIKGLGEAQTAKIQPDDKIIIAGYVADLFGTYYAITLGRLNANGSIDSTFGTNGTIITDAGKNCHEIAIQQDGKILVTGETGIAFLTLRYLPDGNLDNSFGNNGSVTTIFDGGTPKTANANTIQPDGKIIVAGGDNHKIMLARYNGDGSLDETFGNNGEVISDITNINPLNKVYDMVLQPDGKLLLTGTTVDAFGMTNSTIILRYMPDGSFDTSFGNKGIVVRSLQYSSDAFGIALQKDSKIIIGGDYISDGINPHFLAERYNADGSIDASFGNGGYQVTAMDQSDEATGLIIQNDGKIVLAGFALSTQAGPSGYEVALTRYNNDTENKKQIIITKIRRWLQHHNGIEWDYNSNISSYVVQHSYDGIHFSSVARINANNNANYTYQDPSLLNNTNYYRLQTTSVNGTVNYSNVLVVTNNEIKIAPNPATNSLHIRDLSSTQKSKITVVDIAGNIKLQTVANASSFNLNIASLKPGNYLLKIEMNNEVVTKQFVKE